MSIENKQKRIRNIVSGLVVLGSYLLQLISKGIGYNFSASHVIKVLLVSFLFGVIAYLVVTFIFWLIYRFKNSTNKNKTIVSITSTITSADVCEICDEVTQELHKIISDSLQIPDFESDLVDDMTQEITKSWFPPCVAFCYGLVSIRLLKADNNFLDTDVNKKLQNHVLQKMANKTKETAVLYGEGEKSNLELVEGATDDLKTVIQGVDYYFKHASENNKQPFAKLIEFLSGKVHKDLVQNIPEIEDVATALLGTIDAKIENMNHSSCAT